MTSGYGQVTSIQRQAILANATVVPDSVEVRSVSDLANSKHIILNRLDGDATEVRELRSEFRSPKSEQVAVVPVFFNWL